MAQTSYWERITRSRISRRRAIGSVAAAGAGAAALSIVGCGGGGDGGSGGGSKVDPNAVLYNWQLPDDTKKAISNGAPRRPLQQRHHRHPRPDQEPELHDPGRGERLLRAPPQRHCRIQDIDPASAEGRKIRGGLAESYEVSSDASQFTFKMRPNVKFHPIAPVNGRAMDIDDWRVTMERTMASSPLLGGGPQGRDRHHLLPGHEDNGLQDEGPQRGLPATVDLRQRQLLRGAEGNSRQRERFRAAAHRHQPARPHEDAAFHRARVQAPRGLLGGQALHHRLERAHHPRDRKPARPVHYRQLPRLHAAPDRRPAPQEGLPQGADAQGRPRQRIQH